MRVYVEDGDTILRAIKELGLKRDNSGGDLLCDTYLTSTGSKVRFYLDLKPWKEPDVKGWRTTNE